MDIDLGLLRTVEREKEIPFEELVRIIEQAQTLTGRRMSFRAAPKVFFNPYLGIAIDSSFAPGFVGSCCEIALPMGRCEPVTQDGVAEWPIAAIEAREGWRHGQLTALSFGEMRAAVRHAAASDWPAFILVSHSFELFDRAKQRPNPVLMRRFADFCEWLGTSDIAKGTGFAALPEIETGVQAPLMPHNPLRTMRRMAEQMLANAL